MVLLVRQSCKKRVSYNTKYTHFAKSFSKDMIIYLSSVRDVHILSKTSTTSTSLLNGFMASVYNEKIYFVDTCHKAVNRYTFFLFSLSTGTIACDHYAREWEF